MLTFVTLIGFCPVDLDVLNIALCILEPRLLFTVSDKGCILLRTSPLDPMNCKSII
jgi:hypothetical protein